MGLKFYTKALLLVCFSATVFAQYPADYAYYYAEDELIEMLVYRLGNIAKGKSVEHFEIAYNETLGRLSEEEECISQLEMLNMTFTMSGYDDCLGFVGSLEFNKLVGEIEKQFGTAGANDSGVIEIDAYDSEDGVPRRGGEDENFLEFIYGTDSPFTYGDYYAGPSSENDEKPVEPVYENGPEEAELHQINEEVAQNNARLYVPWDHETVSCKRWKTQVLDCGDPNQGRNGQKGQKGVRGDAGRDSKGECGVAGEEGVIGEKGQRGNDGKRGPDGRQGDRGPRGNRGEAGPGCDEEELEEMVRRNGEMEEDFEEAVSDQELLEGEYTALEASHEEIQQLLYKFMGG